MEDAITEELPCSTVITSDIVISSQKTTKAKALRHRMMYQTSCASMDHLKHVQNISCFNSVTSESIVTYDGSLGGPCLHIGNPVATLVQCEGLVFLAVAQVNQLQFASRSDLDEIAIHLLVDETAKVDYQILWLVPASVDDDPDQINGWCWSLDMEAFHKDILGRLVHPLNPSISVQTPGKPTFLFDSSFLAMMSSSLYQELLPQDWCTLPVVKCTLYFPYMFAGMFIFDRPSIKSADLNAEMIGMLHMWAGGAFTSSGQHHQHRLWLCKMWAKSHTKPVKRTVCPGTHGCPYPLRCNPESLTGSMWPLPLTISDVHAVPQKWAWCFSIM